MRLSMRRYTVFFLYNEKSLPVWVCSRIIIFSRALLFSISISRSDLMTGICLRKSMSLAGNSLAGATISTSTESMALRGMLSNFAVAGSCTITVPFFSFMARSPILPSEPMPERMTPTPSSFRSSASERKKKSIGRRSPLASIGLDR